MSRSFDALAHLSERPWVLFLVLLSVNTLARPYAGITHDARLYSVQVLNRVEEGAYADDLFFRYGSQDEYSLFSRLAAPFVRALGLPLAFFGIYLLSKSLLICGMIRLMQTLIPNRTATTLALIYAMAISLHYGGHHILNIQETFVTPRMPAIALVLLGLDLLLRGRPIASGLLLFGAAAIHPLMAFAGLLIWGGFLCWNGLGTRAFIGVTILIAVLAAVVLAVEPIGKRCFGEMDDAWRQTILNSSSFNFPSEWTRGDWFFLTFQLIVLGVMIARFWHVEPVKARFLIVLMLVTFAGAIGAIAAEQLPYAILLQGQPYRALWILSFLHLGFVAWLFVDWTQHPSVLVQLADCVLLGYLCCHDVLLDEFILPAFLFPLILVALRGLESTPRRPHWFIEGIQVSLLLGSIGWVGYKYYLLMAGHEALLVKYPEMRDIGLLYLANLGPVIFIVAITAGLVCVGPGAGMRPAWGWTMAIGCVGFQTVVFALPESDYYRANCTRYRADLQAIHDRLHHKRAPGQPLPSVYCALGCVDYVWVDLHAKCYFDWWQAGNYMFRREMAMEGSRRAHVVGPFEIARLRKKDPNQTEGSRESLERMFQVDYDRGPVTQADLARLCSEPGLDYVIVEHRFDGLFTAQYGELYLYECQQVRAALKLAEPAPRKALAFWNSKRRETPGGESDRSTTVKSTTTLLSHFQGLYINERPARITSPCPRTSSSETWAAGHAISNPPTVVTA